MSCEPCGLCGSGDRIADDRPLEVESVADRRRAGCWLGGTSRDLWRSIPFVRPLSSSG